LLTAELPDRMPAAGSADSCWEVEGLRIIRTILEDNLSGAECAPVKMILVLDMEAEMGRRTGSIRDLAAKLEAAFPGLLAAPTSDYVHLCGDGITKEEHPFREEIKQGTSIPHLLEHIIIHLLGRANGACTGYSGQRSSDIEQGLTSRYYIVVDCADKLEALVAADLAIQLVYAWLDGRTVRIDPDRMLAGISERLEAMVRPPTAR